MELEALKSRFDEALGSTKLQFSEQTMNEFLQDVLAEIGDDDNRCTEEFIQRKVNFAKKIDGQMNFDVSNRIKDWQKKNQNPKPKPNKTEEKGGEDGEPEWFKAYREQQEAKFTEMENARKEEKQKAEKESMLAQIKSDLKAKFAEAGIETNAYIFQQTLRDVVIPTENADVSAIVKQTEKEYYKNLKLAGFEEAIPRTTGGGNGKGSKVVNDFFERKKQREGWGQKK